MVKKYRIDESGKLDAEAGSPPTTIVGGQPQRGLHQEVRIPVGIERALYLAAKDPEFRARLLEKRAGAVRDAGLELTDTETSVLDNQPEPALVAAIDRLSPEDHGRRRFMKAVAASFVSVAAGTASEGCAGCGNVKHDAGVHFGPDGCVPDVQQLDDAGENRDGDEADAGADTGTDASVQQSDGGTDGNP